MVWRQGNSWGDRRLSPARPPPSVWPSVSVWSKDYFSKPPHNFSAAIIPFAFPGPWNLDFCFPAPFWACEFKLHGPRGSQIPNEWLPRPLLTEKESWAPINLPSFQKLNPKQLHKFFKRGADTYSFHTALRKLPEVSQRVTVWGGMLSPSLLQPLQLPNLWL